MSLTDTVRPEHADHLRFVAFGGFGRNRDLARAGVLDVIPCRVSVLPALLRSRAVRVDVAMVQVAPANSDGLHSLGPVADYVRAAIESARTVIAEVNAQVPRTMGETLVPPSAFHHVIHTDRPLAELPPADIGPVERRIGALVADLIADGSVLQFGIGAIPEAVLAALAGKRDLGIHSGSLTDGVIDLIEDGTVTNGTKPNDAGVTVTGVLLGTRRLFDFAHENPSVALRPATYTHAAEVIAAIPTFVSVNAAIEVDLSGQVNAEMAAGRYIGAVGGQPDFARAGSRAPAGRSVIALQSTTKGGQSRIVPVLADAVVTSPRSDVDAVVTEWGVADLRGTSLAERTRRLRAVAHPDHRESLAAATGAARCRAAAVSRPR